MKVAQYSKKFDLTDQEFNKIRRMVYDTIGVNLTDAKRALTISRVSKRLKDLNIASFSDYIAFIEKEPTELENLVNVITTNVTRFFREEYHFDFLTKQYLRTNNPNPEKIRIWSAGCSTGEEPYSIAMILNEYYKDKKDIKIQILASDINTRALDKAVKGIYTKQEIQEVPYRYLVKYFKLGIGPNVGLFKVKDNIKNLISFKKINLTSNNEYPIKEPIDLIFCRNVFIYFDKQTQYKILYKFYKILKPQGLLFLGHSESIHNENFKEMRWRLIKHTIYEKLL